MKRGYAASREEAQAAIRAGLVIADGRPVAKPAQLLPDSTNIQYTRAHPYVSRGGLKLAAALDWFGLSPQGQVCLDCGASTGGFTQVLLERGAAKVYAVDSGHGQMHPRIVETGRVIVMEGVNARDLGPQLIPEPPGVVTADLSFISLRQAMSPALSLAAPGGWAVLLVKPQFEAGRDAVPADGVIRDERVQAKAVAAVAEWVSARGWVVTGVMESPITGKEGNREFLLAARNTASAE